MALLRAAYNENAKAKEDEANKAKGQPLAAQANIGGSSHNASASDSNHYRGPQNGFLELRIFSMGISDFMLRLQNVEGVSEVILGDKVTLENRGWCWGDRQCVEVRYSSHPNNPVEFGLDHWWRTYKCACRPALGSPHKYVCTRVCTHGMCIVVCFYAMCKSPARENDTNKDQPGEWVLIAAFYNCPRAHFLLETSFRVLYEAVRDVAFNPEQHAPSSQGQPLAPPPLSIPARDEEDAPKENMPLPLDGNGSVPV